MFFHSQHGIVHRSIFVLVSLENVFKHLVNYGFPEFLVLVKLLALMALGYESVIWARF